MTDFFFFVGFAKLYHEKLKYDQIHKINIYPFFFYFQLNELFMLDNQEEQEQDGT